MQQQQQRQLTFSRGRKLRSEPRKALSLRRAAQGCHVQTCVCLLAPANNYNTPNRLQFFTAKPYCWQHPSRLHSSVCYRTPSWQVPATRVQLINRLIYIYIYIVLPRAPGPATGYWLRVTHYTHCTQCTRTRSAGFTCSPSLPFGLRPLRAARALRTSVCDKL